MHKKLAVELRPHTIILPSYCPVVICLTRGIAEEVAKSRGYKGHRIEPTTKRDMACFFEGSGLL
ncbi:MAG: hypothetical protein [Caudoviricetes sp.]|nr:MAG: hypothetical protein [Caudoviricetes sp.]